jgi:hypothetical protein
LIAELGLRSADLLTRSIRNFAQESDPPKIVFDLNPASTEIEAISQLEPL